MSETWEESLSRQFSDWEHRCRGWGVFEHPIELEPQLVPFYFFDLSLPFIDDGRKEGFLDKLLGNSHNQQATALQKQHSIEIESYQEYLAETDCPTFCQYYQEDFLELRLIFPKDFEVSKTIVENLLLSFAYAKHPISFEVIGTITEINIQIAVSEADCCTVKTQLKSHLPSFVMMETNDYLSDVWVNGSDEFIVVDFGLSNEFFLPLNVSSSHFESDILTTLVGALNNLQNGEVGVFQVLLQKTKQNWTQEIQNAFSYFDGTQFFKNKPNLLPLTKQKFASPLFSAIVRIAAKSHYPERSFNIVRSLGAGLVSLSNPIGNELIPLSNDGYFDYEHEQALLNRQSYRLGMILNLDEIVSLVHPPTKRVVSEKLLRESEKTKAAPSLVLLDSFHRTLFSGDKENKGFVFLGENIYQNTTNQVFLSSEQRTRHLHLIGSSGSGKSTLLLNLIKQDLENRQGLCVIDPHGDLIEDVIQNVPNERLRDVILFDPSDSEFPIGFNILQANSELEKNLLSSDLIATFRRMATSWGDVMDSVLANSILAFVESSKGGTLFDLRRFLVEKEFRDEFLQTVPDPAIKYFWQFEYPQLSSKPQSSILIRLDSFLRNKTIRNIVCQKQTKLNFRKIMDDGKVLLIKLSQGLIGEENAYLLGTLLVSKIYQTALSRQNSQTRPYFWIYLDEFQHFITPSMENILSGIRKYNLGLHLSHQEHRQLQSRNTEVASSVLSNCYTRICFRLGDTDSEKFASGFSFFDSKALQNLGIGQAIARVERAEFDFNLQTFPHSQVETKLAKQRHYCIVENTRANFAKAKAKVEAELFTDSRTKETPSMNPNSNVKNNNQNKEWRSNQQNKEEAQANNPVAPGKTTEKTDSNDFIPKSQDLFLNTKNNKQSDNSHRYLQNIIKRIGESKGFIATLEKQVFGGIGKIDVALENEFSKVACEVAVTNTIEYELQNIQKCLVSGFDKVLVISSDLKHLSNIKRKAEEMIAENQLKKAHFLAPENVHLFLEKLNAEIELKSQANQNNKATKVKGYQVKVDFKEVNQSEQSEREQRINEILQNAKDRQNSDNC